MPDELVVLGSSKINTQNAEVSSELRQQEIESLPLEGRDVKDNLLNSPALGVNEPVRGENNFTYQFSLQYRF